MRTIKFRAKRIADGQWMTGYLFLYPTPTGEKEAYIATFEGIYKRVVPDDEMFYVHWGNFKEGM